MRLLLLLLCDHCGTCFISLSTENYQNSAAIAT